MGQQVQASKAALLIVRFYKMINKYEKKILFFLGLMIINFHLFAGDDRPLELPPVRGFCVAFAHEIFSQKTIDLLTCVEHLDCLRNEVMLLPNSYFVSGFWGLFSCCYIPEEKVDLLYHVHECESCLFYIWSSPDPDDSEEELSDHEFEQKMDSSIAVIKESWELTKELLIQKRLPIDFDAIEAIVPTFEILQ